MKKIYFTVTNDLTYDQRMHRICTTLAENGYAVTLVGVELSSSISLVEKKFKQQRIRCWFNKGKRFYAEYNIRLLFFLLFKKMDAICAIDLDTILPCLHISRWKKIPRIYDAHEFFTEMKEVYTRPGIKAKWTRIEKYAVPKFKWGYTVGQSIAEEFYNRYRVHYKTIRNVPLLRPFDASRGHDNIIIYTGAVNEARGFEYLIPAMQWVNSKLVICGNGNFMQQVKKIIADYNLEDKIELKGMLPPEELWAFSHRAIIGVNLSEKEGLNQFFALSNKFFDYFHAGLPQVAMNFPEYQKINSQFEIALLMDELAPKRIAEMINNLLSDTVLYIRLKENCLKARLELNWQNEQKKLIDFYSNVFAN